MFGDLPEGLPWRWSTQLDEPRQLPQDNPATERWFLWVPRGDAEYIASDVGGTVHLPDRLPYELAAPTLCAGYTVRAGLRRADVRPGARVAVAGIGGLGHLAIQYAKAAGYHVTALTRTRDKQDLALKLGTDEVVADGAALREAGGTDLLMHCSSSRAMIVDAMEGLRPWGKVVVNGIGFDDMTVRSWPGISSRPAPLGR